jgi:uncharacterized protein (TIGR02246 family)
MPGESGGTVAEAEIRALVDARVRAVRTGDVDASVADLSPDVMSFDVVGPLRRAGSGDVRERVAQWFGTFSGPIGYEVRDLRVTAGQDVAFAHYLYRVSGSFKAGGGIHMWVRATLGCERVDGRWMVTHAHDSVPFDPTTGKASLDVEP